MGVSRSQKTILVAARLDELFRMSNAELGSHFQKLLGFLLILRNNAIVLGQLFKKHGHVDVTEQDVVRLLGVYSRCFSLLIRHLWPPRPDRL